MPSTYRKKLIEVALPLDAINAESAREKSIRHGHPSTLHLWWARRPLAACRAVLFAQLVDDPSEYMPDEKSADQERERLFELIEELVKWENINNEEVVDRARLEIARSVARDLGEPFPVGEQAIREFLATKAPPVLDPFAGGGSIPLEAQRLGLRAYASDINPVAVLINKALIEIPPKFANLPPVHPPESEEQQLSFVKKEWKGAEGLAEDVRYYGKWMRDEAEKRIGYLYPKYKITRELLNEHQDLKKQGLKPGNELTVIAWLWARTVKCPNPACGVQMPLFRSFMLSTQKGRESWLEPIIDRSTKPPEVWFTTKSGKNNVSESPKIGRGAQFRCLACGQIAPEIAIRSQFQRKEDGVTLISIATDSTHGRYHLPPIFDHVVSAKNSKPKLILEEEMNTKTPNLVSGRGYGINRWNEVFTSRQLVLMGTFIEILKEAYNKIKDDAESAGLLSRCESIEQKGTGVISYNQAITVYLAEAVSKLSTFHNKFSYWRTKENKSASGFGKQALAMTWDFAEVNPFANAGGDFSEIAEKAAPKVLLNTIPAFPKGIANQDDATSGGVFAGNPIIFTDPPYYDNIGYADLSDYFYIWLRRCVSEVYPNLFGTILVPKSKELIAEASRFNNDRKQAKDFFEDGLRKAFIRIRSSQNNEFPFAVFYAFKQTETDIDDDLLSEQPSHVSTGWETMLEGLIKANFTITGTWPMRTENETRALATGGGGTNALASSIVLVCRPRQENSPTTTRRDFLSVLKRELPPALSQLKHGSIAPVDLAQAAIGPGMAVFSRYREVLEADGSAMSVHTALALINQALDEYLAEQEGEYEADTRWALAWYEQYGFTEGPFGVAETLSKAKNTSVDGLVSAGILFARAGKVRLLKREELSEASTSGGMIVPMTVPTIMPAGAFLWDPSQDKRPTAWEAVQYLIRSLDVYGEKGAALLLSQLGELGETARDLAYRLYTICERKGWAQDALGYNMLVVAWPRLKEMARSQRPPEQGRLL